MVNLRDEKKLVHCSSREDLRPAGANPVSHRRPRSAEIIGNENSIAPLFFPHTSKTRLSIRQVGFTH